MRKFLDLAMTDIRLHEERIPIERGDEVVFSQRKDKEIIKGWGIWHLQRFEIGSDSRFDLGLQRRVPPLGRDFVIDCFEVGHIIEAGRFYERFKFQAFN